MIIEMLENLKALFRGRKTTRGVKRVRRIYNYTPYEITIVNEEGDNFTLPPAKVEVRVKQIKTRYEGEVRGESLCLHSTPDDVEIEGLEFLPRTWDDELAIVTEEVFRAIMNHPVLSREFKDRVAELPYCKSRINGLTAVVRDRDLRVL